MKPVFNMSYLQGVIIIGVVYLLLYGFFLKSSNGLPYVMDNNESFSCMIHAENMYNFGFSKSYGLTDESASPDISNPNAHPFVHTHQGNFPRLFSFLLYLLGARTVESQIIITTLTIGLATVLLAYHFIAKITFPFFSLVTCLLMVSDYILFSQWQVNTYRVWYGFFFFYTLCCVHGIGGKHQKLFLGLLGLNFICIFYWEFVFASFLWTLSAAYALFLYRRRLKLFGVTLVIQCLGAVLALGVLFSQLVLYMGLENVLKDAYYTISARNFVSDPQKMAEVQSFYENVNVAFFMNFMESAKVRTVDWFLSSLFKYNFIVYTPYLVFIGLLLVGGWFINSLMEMFKLDGWWRKWGHHWFASNPKKFWSKQIILFLGCWVLLSASWMDFSLLGAQKNFLSSIFSWKGPFILLLSVMGSFAVVFLVSRISTRAAYWSSLRVGMVFASLLLLAYFIRVQGFLYGSELQAIWKEMFNLGLSLLIYPALPISMAIFLILVLDGKKGSLRKIQKKLNRIWPVLCCALLGYWVVWLWAAGYLYSGYLVRWCPFINFAFYPLIALAVCTPFILFSHLQIQGRKKHLQEGTVDLGQLFLLAVIAFLIFYWSKLQTLYVKYLPPTHAQFLKKFRKEPFKNSSFISNHYALPITHMTKSWAYQIPPDISDYLIMPSRSLEMLKQATIYRWFADRHENPAYTKPQYFLHWGIQNQLNIVSDRIASEKQKRSKESIGYFNNNLIKTMIQQEKLTNTQFQIAARDQGKWQTWAIIKLDWNLPPYLKSLENQSIWHNSPWARKKREEEIKKRKNEGQQIILKLEPSKDFPHMPSSRVWVEKIKFGDNGQAFFHDQSLNPGHWALIRDASEKEKWLLEPRAGEQTLSFNIEESFWNMEILHGPTAGRLTVLLGGKEFVFDLQSPRTEMVPLSFDLRRASLQTKGESPGAIKGEMEINLKGHHIKYHVQRTSDEKIQIHPTYRYQHSQDAPEENSILKLYQSSAGGDWKKTEETSLQKKFTLPPDFKGEIRISVTPKGGGREGMEYFGPILSLP